MRVVICDDDSSIISHLKELVTQYFKSNKYTMPEIVSYTNGHSFLKDDMRKDIVFLDIEMPDVNGLYIGNLLARTSPNTLIIVVTSFNGYLDDTMRFHVFRYLTKPIERNRLFNNLDDALNELRKKERLEQRIAVIAESETIFIPCSQIIYIDTMNHGTYMHTTDSKNSNIKTKNTMEEWTKILPCEFFYQTHRTSIINLSFVSRFSHNTVYLDNSKYAVCLAVKKYSEFSKICLAYMETGI